MLREFINGTAYIKLGHGKPLVLIHGVGMNAAIWRPQLECFSSCWQVFAVDMLGHGESTPPPNGATFGDYCEQTNDFLDTLALEDVTLVGHSMGGLVAIAVALSCRRRVGRLAVLNTVYRRSELARQAVLARAQTVTESLVVDVDEPLLRWFGKVPATSQQENLRQVKESLLTINPQSYAVAYRVFADNDWRDDDKLSQLTMPTLFMSGDADKNATPVKAEKMAIISGGKNIIVANAGHMMPLTAATAVNDALLDFMKT